jgi:N-acyl-D-aspartate/D-glutamate deacylase
MGPITLLIRNGRVVDGTASAVPFIADVAIAGDRIAAIGRLPKIGGVDEIDASGLVVAPGFIDIHSHSDFTLLVDPRAVSSITQGVTLEIIGNCGYGCCPIADPAVAKEIIYGYTPLIPISWTSVDRYLRHLEMAAPAVNVATLVPTASCAWQPWVWRCDRRGPRSSSI